MIGMSDWDLKGRVVSYEVIWGKSIKQKKGSKLEKFFMRNIKKQWLELNKLEAEGGDEAKKVLKARDRFTDSLSGHCSRTLLEGLFLSGATGECSS